MDLINTLLPLDVLRIILHFVDTIPDSLNVLRICKKWFYMISRIEGHWISSLNLWRVIIMMKMMIIM
jgi:hypothetical protein